MTGKDIDRCMFCFLFNNYVYHKLKAVEQEQSAGSRKFQGPVRKFGLDSGLELGEGRGCIITRGQLLKPHLHEQFFLDKFTCQFLLLA